MADQVSETERVARALFDPSFYHEGQLSRRTFELRNGEIDISVFRESLCIIANEIEKIPERANQTLVGYASLLVSDILSIKTPEVASEGTPNISVNVVPEPSKFSAAHAGIISYLDGIPIKGRKDNEHISPLFSYIQGRLVEMSTLVIKDIQ